MFVWIYEMNVLMLLLFFLNGMCSWITVRLVVFLLLHETTDVCRECAHIESCYAKKITRLTSAENMYQWMIISSLKVFDRCQSDKNVKKGWIIIITLVGCVTTSIFLWSGQMRFVPILYSIVAIMLLHISIVDWNTQYIPLEMTVVIFVCGLMRMFADFSNWFDYAIGLIAVSGFLFVIDRIMTPVLCKQHPDEEIESVIGDGDIKLMAATGLLIGWKLNFLALGIGCITGSVIHLIRMKIKGSGSMLALGPYLSLGVYITMICGEQLISWYLNMLGVYPN